MSVILSDGLKPASDFETTVQADDSMTPSSPASQELWEFGAYSRAALPQLVEANLRATLDTDLKPIEENLRTQLVDIVRRCQSVVEENFRITRGSKVGTGDGLEPIISAQPGEDVPLSHTPVPATTMQGQMTDFFHEPPLMAPEMNISFAPIAGFTGGPDPFKGQLVDSTYGTLPEPCECVCHVFCTNTCNDCIGKHSDLGSSSFDEMIDSDLALGGF